MASSGRGNILVFYSCYEKAPQAAWRQQQNLLSHSSGGWKDNIKVSAGLVGFFWGFSPWIVDGRVLPVSPHGLLFVRVYVKFPPTYKDTSLTG